MEALALAVLIVSTNVANTVCRCVCTVVAATMKARLEVTRGETVIAMLEKCQPSRGVLISFKADSALVRVHTPAIDHMAMLPGRDEEAFRGL